MSLVLLKHCNSEICLIKLATKICLGMKVHFRRRLVIPPYSSAESPGDAVTWRACVRVSDLVELRIGQAALAGRSRAPRRGPACEIQTGFRRKLADSHIRARQRYTALRAIPRSFRPCAGQRRRSPRIGRGSLVRPNSRVRSDGSRRRASGRGSNSDRRLEDHGLERVRS